eukprot:scaffold478026_cov49-Prasinocladus_malaysianus.AAC.1
MQSASERKSKFGPSRFYPAPSKRGKKTRSLKECHVGKDLTKVKKRPGRKPKNKRTKRPQQAA